MNLHAYLPQTWRTCHPTNHPDRRRVNFWDIETVLLQVDEGLLCTVLEAGVRVGKARWSVKKHHLQTQSFVVPVYHAVLQMIFMFSRKSQFSSIKPVIFTDCSGSDHLKSAEASLVRSKLECFHGEKAECPVKITGAHSFGSLIKALHSDSDDSNLPSNYPANAHDIVLLWLTSCSIAYDCL